MNVALNIHTCIYGPQATAFFNTIGPPSMVDYLSNANSGALAQYYA